VIDVVLSVRDLSVHQGRRLIVQRASVELRAGQALGVVGANGSGKTTLLRTLVGLLHAAAGEIRIEGRLPPEALQKTPTAYFAGDSTLPGFVRAAAWGSLGAGDIVTSDRRRIRALSRSTRQLLGLRTALGRHPLRLIVLDEPWEGLDPDATRWLSSTLQSKRDRGAAVVLSSHRLHDLAGVCDKYLLLTGPVPTLLRAHDIARSGVVSAEQLIEAFDQSRERHTAAIALPPLSADVRGIDPGGDAVAHLYRQPAGGDDAAGEPGEI
jgi:ABC-2 type transport system ATP-binding protein